MDRNSCGQFNNDDSSVFALNVHRSVPNAGRQKSSIVDQHHFFDFSSAMDLSMYSKLSLDKSTFSSPSQSNFLKHPLHVHSPIPIFPSFYYLENTNFRTSIDKRVLIQLIKDFLLECNIDSKWKPIKYKFKCTSKEGVTFVIRLFQDNSNSVYIIEVQYRSGNSVIFKDLFNSLRLRIFSSSNPTNNRLNKSLFSMHHSFENYQLNLFLNSPSLHPPPLATTSTTTTSMTTITSTIQETLSIEEIKTQLTSLLKILSSPMIDSQEIAIEQLYHFLLRSQSQTNVSYPQQGIVVIEEEEEEAEEEVIELYKKTEKILYDLIIFFWRLKQYLTLDKIFNTLHVFYDFRAQTMAQSMTWKCPFDINESIIVILDVVSSSLQSKFISISAASVIQSLVSIYPEKLIQNNAINKLSLAIARQSQRDFFKIDFPEFEKRLQALIKRLIVS